MAVTITLSKYNFSDLFETMGRGENFSRCAREALFDDLETMSEDTGKDIAADIVAICCDWTEYESAELLRAYSSYLPEGLASYTDEDEAASALIEVLKDETQVIELSNGCTLVQCF